MSTIEFDKDPDGHLEEMSGAELERGTVTAVRTIGRSKNVAVHFAGDGVTAATDSANVLLPSIPQDRMMSRSEVAVTRGFADHEAIHRRLSEFKTAAQKMKELHDTGRHRTLHLVKALEDMRIENGARVMYPAAMEGLNAVVDHTIKHLFDTHVKEHPEVLKEHDKVLPVAITWAGRKLMGYPSTALDKALDAIEPETRDKAFKYAQMALNVQHGATGLGSCDEKVAHEGCMEIFDLATRILAEEEQEKEEDEKGRGGEEPEEDGDPVEGEGGEINEAMTPEEAEAFAKKAEARAAKEGESLDPDMEDAVHDMLNNNVTKFKGKSPPYSLPFTTAQDKITDELSWMKSRENLDEVIRMRRVMGSRTATMRRKLEMALKANEMADWQHGRSGRLDVRRRGVHIVKGREDVFRQRIEGKEINTAVTLLVDCSGSMSGKKMELAGISALAMAEAIDSIGIPLEVIGFTTGSLSGEHAARYGASAAEWNRGKRGPRYTRMEPLLMPLFKPFNVELRRRLLQMGSIPRSARSNNVDGECLMIAAQRLAARPENRKVLIVLSDGQPAYDTEFHDCHEQLKRTVPLVEKMGVDLFGVGICSDAVRHYYKNHAVLRSVDDLPKAVLSALAQFLLGKRYKVDNADLKAAS